MKVKALIIGACLLATTSVLNACTILPQTNVEIGKYQKTYNSVCYNQLTDGQRSIYDNLVIGFADFKEEISVKGALDDVKVAYDCVLGDHPEYFYIDGYIYNEKQTIFGTKSNTIVMFPNYLTTKPEYDEQMTEIDAKADEVIADIDESLTDYEKAKTVYEKIIALTDYDETLNYTDTLAATLLTGRATCNGYASTFTYLLQKLNIPCVTVSGTVNFNNVNNAHAWNIMLLDDNNYLVDATNGDSVLATATGTEYEIINYNYFALNPKNIDSYQPTDSFANINKCTAIDYNYYVKEGLSFTSYDFDGISKAIQNARDNGKKEVTLSFDSNVTGILEMVENQLFGQKDIQKILGNVNVNYTDNASFKTLTILFN